MHVIQAGKARCHCRQAMQSKASNAAKVPEGGAVRCSGRPSGRKFERRTVQQQPVASRVGGECAVDRALAMRCIPDDRVCDVLEMAADLMAPPVSGRSSSNAMRVAG